MTTYNTGNPVPSADARDRYDNSQTLDEVVNGDSASYETRTGKQVISLGGMNSRFNNAQDEREADFNLSQEEKQESFQKFIDGTGWSSLGAYGAGLVITSHTQTVDYLGQPYSLKPSIPASLDAPYVTTGVWATEGINFKLVGDNSLRQELAEPSGATKLSYTYGSAHSEGREVSDKLQEARSILDFVPRSQKSAMKDGTSRWSATVAMNYALRETAGGILIPPGCIVPIDGPIDLDRSNEIVGGGPFDTTPGKGSKIYMLDGSNCEAIRTPYAVNPVTGSQTHFMGLRNLVIDGNKSGQTAEVAGGLVKFWGAFVGSGLEKVLILNSYGTALDLRGGSDVELSHLWITGCATETGYALDTNAQLTGGTLGGLLQFSNLYVENTSIDKNFSAKENEAYRGKNIRFRRLVSLSATDIHTEGAAIGVDLDQNTLVNIGKITSYNIGSTNTTEGSLVRHIGGMSRAVNIGPMTMSGRTNDPYFVRKSADLPVNNFVPEVKRLTNPFVNRYTSVYDSLLPYSKESPAAYSGVMAVERPTGFSEVAIRMTWGDSADPASGISRFKEKGLGPIISSNINQPGGVDKDFISARSSGGAGDSITLSDPFKPGTRSTSASIQSGMIYLGAALPSIGTGPAFQRLTGLAAGADALATARRVNGPPTTGAVSIGIFYTDTSTPAPHKVYMSTNFTGEVSDWSPLN